MSGILQVKTNGVISHSHNYLQANVSTDSTLKYCVLLMVSWLRVLLQGAVGSSSRTRIFYLDNSQKIADNNTDYSDRIEVTSDEQGTRLIIQDVRLLDEREFFCQVNGMAAGSAEGKTQLRVFGKGALSRGRRAADWMKLIWCNDRFFLLLQLLQRLQ